MSTPAPTPGHEISIAERDAMIEHLQEQVRLLLAQRFAPSSEKIPDGQLGLFNEAEASVAQEESESVPDTEVAAYRRGRPKRAPLPAYLPRIDIVHALPESERTCPHHAVELERFGEVVSEQLDIVPAKVRVLRHIRGKYRCPSCEGHLRTAPMPAQPLPKSFASPGLLSFIATAKYADALPLYRQHRQLQRIGVECSRTTLARWMVGAGELVVPLINVLRDELLDRPYLLMDETIVQVLKEPGKAPESKSQLWAQMSAGPEPPIVLFDYDPTRAGEVPMRLLAGFTGALHTDGYSGYGPAVREYDLVHLACWANVAARNMLRRSSRSQKTVSLSSTARRSTIRLVSVRYWGGDIGSFLRMRSVAGRCRRRASGVTRYWSAVVGLERCRLNHRHRASERIPHEPRPRSPFRTVSIPKATELKLGRIGAYLRW